jgi:osmotically inducible lipoprotein OsmB
MTMVWVKGLASDRTHSVSARWPIVAPRSRAETEFKGACPQLPSLSMETPTMNHLLRHSAIAAAVGVATLSLSACGSMSERDRNTAVGAAVGGVAGSVLSGGSTAGTVGGAVVGGVIGNQVDKDEKKP